MATNHASDHDAHRPNVGLYMLVFGALLALTCLTVVISKFHLPRPQAIALGLLVAGVKASLVAAVFMHLWGEHKLIHKGLYVTVFCGSILVIVLIDCHAAIGRLTGRLAVAEQRPAEAAEGMREERVALPADVAPAKAAGNPAKGRKNSMSLQSFHKVFIAAALACCVVIARWASGHNAAALVTPWARDAAIAGMILLAPYFAWRVKSS